MAVGELHFQKLKSLHWRARLSLPDMSLSTEEKMSAAGILTLHKQRFYNKGTLMYTIVNNDAPDYT